MRRRVIRNAVRLISSAVALTLLAASAGPLALQTFAADIYLVGEDEIFHEDLYISASVVRVHGTIEGDLSVVAGSVVQISGAVTGDVLVVSPEVRIDGEVGGSVRAVTVDADITGAVGGDIALLARQVVLDGTVGGDMLTWAYSLALTGGVGRDLRGRMSEADVAGRVGRDVEISVSQVRIGAGADIGGDFGYRSRNEAEVDQAADLTGGPVRRTPLAANIWLRAGLLMIWAVTLLTAVGVGLLVLHGYRPQVEARINHLTRSPLRVLARGAGALALGTLPVSIPLLAMWAGSPRTVMWALLLGVITVVPALLLLGVLLIQGLIPAVIWLVQTLSRHRIGLYGSMVGGILTLGVLVLIPFVGPITALVVAVVALGVPLRPRTGR